MEKMIPYEKLSKKEQRKWNSAKRGTWGDLNPVTRKPVNSRAYNRKRAQDWKKEFPDLRPYLWFPPVSNCRKMHKTQPFFMAVSCLQNQ